MLRAAALPLHSCMPESVCVRAKAREREEGRGRYDVCALLHSHSRVSWMMLAECCSLPLSLSVPLSAEHWWTILCNIAAIAIVCCWLLLFSPSTTVRSTCHFIGAFCRGNVLSADKLCMFYWVRACCPDCMFPVLLLPLLLEGLRMAVMFLRGKRKLGEMHPSCPALVLVCMCWEMDRTVFNSSEQECWLIREDSEDIIHHLHAVGIQCLHFSITSVILSF